VVGAGPAGSTAANQIAKRGYSVFLIEKDAFPGENSVCAGGIDGVFVQNFNLTEDIIEKNISKSLFHFPRQTYCLNAQQVSVQRNVFDRFLAQEATKEGAQLHGSCLATDVAWRRDGIVLGLKSRATGEAYEVKAKLAIFADGPNTLAFKKLGLGFGSRNPRAFSAIYEIEWEDNPLECFEHFFDRNVSPWGYGWIFPKRDVLNVGVMCLMSMMRGNIKRHLDFLVNKHPVASKKLAKRRILRFAADTIPLQHANKIYGDRVLVVGDAAGMVDPISGAGIGYAIKAGTLAGKVAVRALGENTFNEAFLSQFEREWKRGEPFKSIMKSRLLLTLALGYSRLDNDAYIRLALALQKLQALRNRAHKLMRENERESATTKFS
jgi:digeranylgeranylglycerophospholipid reductase